MAKYEGMRWLKCDFQVQTPEDNANWLDDETRLGDPRRPLGQAGSDESAPRVPDESRIQACARKFLTRCHELGLELIGVTDHNFSQKTEPRDWFLTHLVEQNKSVAKTLGRPPLHILPGFEVDIGYHALCLFSPATKMSHVRRVNMILTKLGLGENQRFRSGHPLPLRVAGQNVSLKHLLEIVQEEHRGIVIAAHSDQVDGILSQPRNLEDYQNTELLAVEVTSNPPAPRYQDIVTGKNPEWSRNNRHPACVMSSDAKSLKTGEDGMPRANALGYRYTWVKMSQPSIEALRQAFLDPASRIRLLGSRPSEQQLHPRLKSIEIKGATFLADQRIEFSENLNCVIGGRGSGKSTLLEYLRFAFSDDEATGIDPKTTLGRKQARLLSTISVPGGEVRVAFETQPGVTDVLVYTPASSAQPRRIEGREVEDLQTVLQQLHAQFFGQGELSSMTGDSGAQRQIVALLDAAGGPELDKLAVREDGAREEVLRRLQASREAAKLSGQARAAAQEVTEVTRQLAARQSVQQWLGRHQAANSAGRFLDSLRESSRSAAERLSRELGDIDAESLNMPGDLTDWPNVEWFVEASASVREAREALLRDVQAALLKYRESVETAVGDEQSTEVRKAIADADEQFKQACERNDVPPEEATRIKELDERKQAKQTYADELRTKLDSATVVAQGLNAAIGELHGVWREQFKVRERIADSLQAGITSQRLKIHVSYMDDGSAFMHIWRQMAPKDGRSKVARRWDEIGEDVFRVWTEGEKTTSPWEIVERFSEDPRALPYLYGQVAEDLQPSVRDHIFSQENLPLWERARVTRIGDVVDVELIRDDGTSAGTTNGALSEGQRNTVLLNLLLARGEGPVVIDQPEDELDSNFIYRALVTDLRAAKERRQIIVATHNANIPVNADAELIHAFEARDGRGTCLTQGGLDRDAVSKAVLDIMEGSEEAFKRRGDKYHF
ncbi:TrlF family AAA-like ATPase [Paraburkholderia sp. J10-1]|uniref:TrlF family AAA-like ATPase n=1 Tax=Paraburkholderia sp. J10-1 TaxID=2805430 RepID=UPI002AB73877|nr:AAA family ATPase [Paraburkholderia sp. J10-1]